MPEKCDPQLKRRSRFNCLSRYQAAIALHRLAARSPYKPDAEPGKGAWSRNRIHVIETAACLVGVNTYGVFPVQQALYLDER